jgi:hypothetical protein
VKEELSKLGVNYSETELADLIGIVQTRMIQEDCGSLPLI